MQPLVAGTRVRRAELAADPDTDPVTLADLADDPSWRVRGAAAANPSTPSTSIDHLVTDPNSRVRIRVAGRPGLSDGQLWTLAGDDNVIVVERVLWAPHLETATMVRLIDHPEFDPEPGLGQRLLPLLRAHADRLAHHRSATLRRLAARSPHLADESVTLLAADRDRVVRLLIATSLRTPRPALSALAGDEDPAVRAAVAQRPDLAPMVARRLLGDVDPSVRAAAAANPAVDGIVVVRRLLARPGVAVRRAVAGNRRAPGVALWLVWLTSRRWDIQAALAANPTAPRPLLWFLMGDRRLAVQVAGAGNRRTPSLGRWMLSHGRRPMVRFALAGNPRATVAMLGRLARLDPLIAQRVASNPAASPQLLRELTMGMDAPAWILRTVATNPTCPSDLAAEALTWLAIGGPVGNADFDAETCAVAPHDQLAAGEWYRRNATLEGRTSPLWRVRATIVSTNKTVPFPTVFALARDPHPLVRRSAMSLRPLPANLAGELLADADPVVAAAARRAIDEGKTVRWTMGKLRVGRLLYRRNFRMAVTLAIIVTVAFFLNRQHYDSGATPPAPAGSLASPTFTVPMFGSDVFASRPDAYALDQATGLELEFAFENPPTLTFFSRANQPVVWHLTYQASDGTRQATMGPMQLSDTAVVRLNGALQGTPVVLRRDDQSTSYTLTSPFASSSDGPTTTGGS
jgi:hypothetical protein